ncbi:hypothetical protein [Streptomyces sp. NPDC026666]|uniref:hypothetical protein n=1 Tax=Streptomyces sp. NPDC026666 TaxID=3154799 RepID=UPI0034551986
MAGAELLRLLRLLRPYAGSGGGGAPCLGQLLALDVDVGQDAFDPGGQGPRTTAEQRQDPDRTPEPSTCG